MNIKIVGTGSSGNCFLFDEKLMIDAGLSYKKLSNQINVKEVKCVLLTHIHGDHFNRTCLRKLFVNTKAVFCCGEWLLDELCNIGITKDRIMILELNKVYRIIDYTISPFTAYHDVRNIGIRIMKDGHKHFHVTDTSTLRGLSAKDYDTATIECNHHEEEANKIIQMCDSKGEFTHLRGALNSHLSVQEVIRFIKDNNIKKLHPVHIGESTRGFVFDELEKAGLCEN